MKNLLELDTQAFWWINSHHSTFTDWTLWFFSQGWSWPIILLTFYFLLTIKHDRKRWWLALLGLGLCILITDRVTVMCFKDVVERLRPCHELENVRMFHTNCGGKYGFVSSHSANAFALAIFLIIRYSRNNFPTISRKLQKTTVITLLSWAAIVAYSRPYLGKHYPADIICGALVGLGLGALVAFIIAFIEKKWLNNETKIISSR